MASHWQVGVQQPLLLQTQVTPPASTGPTHPLKPVQAPLTHPLKLVQSSPKLPKDIPKTAEYYNKVIELNKDHLQAHLNLISVYERMKDWEKALEEITIVKQLSDKTQNQQAMDIAENKLKFIKGRMNLTKKDIKRNSEPPFD